MLRRHVLLSGTSIWTTLIVRSRFNSSNHRRVSGAGYKTRSGPLWHSRPYPVINLSIRSVSAPTTRPAATSFATKRPARVGRTLIGANTIHPAMRSWEYRYKNLRAAFSFRPEQAGRWNNYSLILSGRLT